MAEFDSVIPPGGSGKVVGKVRTGAAQVGRRAKSIRVQTDDPELRVVNLRISYEVVPVIQVLPSARPRIEVMEGKSTAQTVLLRRNDGQPLELSKVQSVLPDVVAAIPRAAEAGERGGDGLVAQAGDVWLDLEVHAPEDGRARSVRVNAVTNDPQMSRLVLPVVVLVKKLVEVRPDQVRLWLGTGDPRYASTEVTLRHAGDEPFALESVESSHPDVYSVTAVSGQPGPLQRVRVELVEPDEDLAGASMRGEIRMTTNLEQMPEVTVPVLVGQRRRAATVEQPQRSHDATANQDGRAEGSDAAQTPVIRPSVPAGQLRAVPTAGAAPQPTPRPVPVGYGGSTR